MNTVNNQKINGTTILIGLVILVAAIVFLPRLFNTNTDGVLPSAEDNPAMVDDNIDLGQPVSATSIDRDGCPVDTATAFNATDDIYVVAPGSDVPAGTSVFVRLYRDSVPVEDAPEIAASSDYSNSCVNFVFEPLDGAFEPGQYEAEFYINGNPADSVTFDVR